ncbi:MAG: hypothetical protein K5910_00850, partial [Bacteroidales bacterium]|nr:hypothetical protein [Bacteroidales bacterium]
MDNAARIREGDLRMREKRLDPLSYISKLHVSSSSSPEGSRALNERLSRERAANTAIWLRSNYRFEEEALEVHPNTLDWGTFERLVASTPGIPEQARVLDIVRRQDYDGLDALKGTD